MCESSVRFSSLSLLCVNLSGPILTPAIAQDAKTQREDQPETTNRISKQKDLHPDFIASLFLCVSHSIRFPSLSLLRVNPSGPIRTPAIAQDAKTQREDQPRNYKKNLKTKDLHPDFIASLFLCVSTRALHARTWKSMLRFRFPAGREVTMGCRDQTYP